MNNLKELYFDQLRDLFSAEQQLLRALPEMVTYASCPTLREALSKHLEETKKHKDRLEKIGRGHGITLEGEDCDAMRGLIKEAKKHIEQADAGDVRDVEMIACLNRIEHYEIAGYGVAKSFAKSLTFDDDVPLLDATLDEEGGADDVLTHLATGGLFTKGLNAAAIH